MISLSVPSGSVKTGFAPVVRASTDIPDPRKAAAIRRVTLDFPRVPVTQIRKGIESTVLRKCMRSVQRKISQTANKSPMIKSPLIVPSSNR
jgi:hypothetical protein